MPSFVCTQNNMYAMVSYPDDPSLTTVVNGWLVMAPGHPVKTVVPVSNTNTIVEKCMYHFKKGNLMKIRNQINKAINQLLLPSHCAVSNHMQ